MTDGGPPLSRLAGRAAGRWWRRYGPGVRRASEPARLGWATASSSLWFMAYGWIGLLLAVGAARVSSDSSVLSTVVAFVGGVVLGSWQSRHRLARHRDPTTPPPARFGAALAAWVGAVVLAVLIQDRWL